MRPTAKSSALSPLTTAGHETTDASVGYVTLSALGLVLIVFLGLGVSLGVYGRLLKTDAAAKPRANPLTASQRPPAPRLQSQPRQSLEAYRRQEHQQMTTYEWLDRKQGIARIPVERAIDIIASKGFPERPPAASTSEPSSTEASPAAAQEKTP
jgi:hypothetical protein